MSACMHDTLLLSYFSSRGRISWLAGRGRADRLSRYVNPSVALFSNPPSGSLSPHLHLIRFFIDQTRAFLSSVELKSILFLFLANGLWWHGRTTDGCRYQSVRWSATVRRFTFWSTSEAESTTSQRSIRQSLNSPIAAQQWSKRDSIKK